MRDEIKYKLKFAEKQRKSERLRIDKKICRVGGIEIMCLTFDPGTKCPYCRSTVGQKELDTANRYNCWCTKCDKRYPKETIIDNSSSFTGDDNVVNVRVVRLVTIVGDTLGTATGTISSAEDYSKCQTGYLLDK